MMVHDRNRVIYGIGVIAVMILGLCSRRYSDLLPGWVGEYAGDVLWALMVFMVIGFLNKKMSTFKTGSIALLFSFMIEVSQLYHSPWIDAIRKTRLGGLILGYGFLWSDLLCYTIGIVIGCIIDKLILNIMVHSHNRSYLLHYKK